MKPAPSNPSAGSRLLVVAQLGFVAHLALTGPVLFLPWPLALVEWAGAWLGLRSIRDMGLSNLRAWPEPRDDAHLVTTGPYRRFRHPMYLALFIVCATWTAARPTFERTASLAALGAILAAKGRREERLLSERFPQYRDYAKRASWL